ncbi:MAG: TonB-dependent receptor plug domain-containing protein [Saprospiraceae bacterium]
MAALVLWCGTTGGGASAQSDSATLIQPERLQGSDVIRRDAKALREMTVSATRSPESPDALPFQVWIISSQEIVTNGYVTLADALRNVPGIRVSQPGNALEGETFMVRGLIGNRYFKILINDVPVKPAAAVGMPVGAQLPIRQAERIEVMIGPGSAIYGDEALAGVVNIIIKETERPVFTQADLSLGRFGYNSLDLMFGGKLGRDKNIFRFSMYGSSTVRSQEDLFADGNRLLLDTRLYKPNYLSADFLAGLDNFRSDPADGALARSAPYVQEGRLVGVNLTWRGIGLSYNRMKRLEHSATGYSPLAWSGFNGADRIEESIEALSLAFKKRKAKRTSYNTLSLLRYAYASTSSGAPIFGALPQAIYAAMAPLQTDQAALATLPQRIYDQYGAGERHFTASGLDLRYESRLNAALRPSLFFDGGAQGNLAIGSPPAGHQRVSGGGASANPIDIPRSTIFDLNIFAQLDWRRKRWSLTTGIAQHYNNLGVPATTPRIGVFYQIDSLRSLYAYHAVGSRRPSMAESVGTLRINRYTGEADAGAGRGVGNERGRVSEIGYRRSGRHNRLYLNAFYQEVDGLVRPAGLRGMRDLSPSDSFAIWGYASGPRRSSSIWGIQAGTTLQNNPKSLYFSMADGRRIPVTLRLAFWMQYAQGKERIAEGEAYLSEIANQPRWMSHTRLSILTSKLQMGMALTRHGKAATAARLYSADYGTPLVLERQAQTRYTDLWARLYLNQHFSAYIILQNVFGKRYAGLDAAASPDDLIYNPQPGRFFRLGVNYNMQ